MRLKLLCTSKEEAVGIVSRFQSVNGIHAMLNSRREPEHYIAKVHFEDEYQAPFYETMDAMGLSHDDISDRADAYAKLKLMEEEVV
jgi:hypothetical protein